MRIDRIHPCLRKDFYKVGHKFQYPDGTTRVVSNETARGTRRFFVPKGTIQFGHQFFVKEYLIDQFNEEFFQKDRDQVVRAYKRRIDNGLGPGTDVSHIGELHELGYLPLHVKALPEGTMVPYRVPSMVHYNTEDKFYWLTNMLETLISQVLWLPPTSATTAFGYFKRFHDFAKRTGVDPSFVQWQGHDFSMRGMDPWSSAISGAAHLAVGFTGTDTIPAIDFLEEYYGANSDTELVGGSVPATEHSVMCMGLEAGEFETFERLITQVYPKGIVSIVSDTWDLGRVLTEYLPRLKDRILQREGKVVIRPDSGDPVKILCGDLEAKEEWARKGVFRCLYEIFGGTTNAAGYIDIDPHIGAIYGDSITEERQVEILNRMQAAGFSTYVVLGIGSFTYQHVTRDTDGRAIKATYGEIEGVGRNIFKAPKTDSGVKNSAKGLLMVDEQLRLHEEVDWDTFEKGLLQTIFLNGKRDNLTDLKTIRANVARLL